MVDKNLSKRVIRSQGNAGFMNGLSNQIRLVLRLMTDSRVNKLLKLLPLGSLIYLLFPEPFPIGPVDDAFIIGLGTYFFFELCPADVVEEHRAAIWGAEDKTSVDGEVVDGKFSE
ncbi:MAG: hypothetical protein OEY93_06965 [Anaerolineae bacterium]|nr:hypothetical protein [Anaerolineae bacterium]